MQTLYNKRVLIEYSENIFNDWYTIYVLNDDKYYNIHIVSELFQDNELNTLQYQESKEDTSIEQFDKLRLTKELIEFALWNKFYGYNRKTYTFTIKSEVGIDFTKEETAA